MAGCSSSACRAGTASRPPDGRWHPAPAAAPGAERKITATLYYISEDGLSLVGVQREVPFGEPVDEQARRIIEAQLAARAAAAALRHPRGTTLRSLFLSDKGHAFVDLSADARTRHTGGALDELFTIYAIVNALTVNLPAITRVQILVEGKEVDTLAGHVDLRHPLQKNLKWVKNGGQGRVMTRSDGRAPGELRPTKLTPGFLMHAEGSVLIEVGRTRVICTASVEDRVPPFLRNSGKGWVTAEYGMLPRATTTRTQREATAGKVGGRTQEIQRLIGRSLRSVTRLAELGERTVWVDCDVIQADGGTRTASITGGFVAMVLALQRLRENGVLKAIPVQDYVAATSVGVVGGMPLLDLAYEEDSRAEVDMNVVKTGDGRFIEVQGTAEGPPFERRALDDLHGARRTSGIRELVEPAARPSSVTC